jgi:hypothetical protein
MVMRKIARLLLPKRAYAMCPPSNCPTGRRLRAVTKRPTHPAYAIGCRTIS